MSYASSAIKRLSNEYRRLQKPENRVREYFAAPLEENIFEWHFTLRGPGGDNNSLPYKDGIYHGALIFSRSYPLEPPDILFITRSGRFAVREKICSTISSYHKELWQPTYDIALTLTALRHFMAQEDEFGLGAFPKSMVPLETKEEWARETWSFQCSICGRATRDVWETEMKMYPEISPDKEAQVPKLPQPRATANPDGAKPQQVAPTSPLPSATSPSPSLSPPQSPSSATADATGRVPEAAAAPGAPQNYKATEGTQPSPTIAPSTPTPPSPSGATATPPPATSGALAAVGCSDTPTSQTSPPDPPAAATLDANAFMSPTPADDDAPHTFSSAAHQHKEEGGAPVTEEGAMSKDNDALADFTHVNLTGVVRAPTIPASGGTEPARLYDVPLESPVGETLQSEADLAAAAAPGNMAPPVTPGVGDDAGTTAGTGPPTSLPVDTTDPPQRAQRVVFCVNFMEVSIPLRMLDRVIIFSFLLVVLILLRRGLCGLLTI
ncbi:hypothetical protein CUR178_07670 [Leishmania enriettii]|uniref:UBC core domain-containing protein n=1 Tax=Leishmania enriettii TaxID=5663 RepID=A0A836I1J2_LEIEN|nr:hypothetical protein CUR178_07670 [Leishmania enriettii]